MELFAQSLKNIPKGYTKEEIKVKSYSVEEIRKNFPKAYCPWDENEDKNLSDYYLSGLSKGKIAELLGRKKGAIHSRLVKLGLIES